LNLDFQDAQDMAKRLQAISDELSDRFYERGDVVRTLMVTLLAGGTASAACPGRVSDAPAHIPPP
jgi:hypothetical protein